MQGKGGIPNMNDDHHSNENHDQLPFPNFIKHQFPDGSPFPNAGPGRPSEIPVSPPPSFIPERPQFQTFSTDPDAVSPCLFEFTYIWLKQDAFWYYPTFLSRRSIAGFRWNGFRWVYFGIGLNQIETYQCF